MSPGKCFCGFDLTTSAGKNHFCSSLQMTVAADSSGAIGLPIVIHLKEESAQLRDQLTEARKVIEEITTTLVPYSPLSDEGIVVESCRAFLAKYPKT